MTMDVCQKPSLDQIENGLDIQTSIDLVRICFTRLEVVDLKVGDVDILITTWRSIFDCHGALVSDESFGSLTTFQMDKEATTIDKTNFMVKDHGVAIGDVKFAFVSLKLYQMIVSEKECDKFSNDLFTIVIHERHDFSFVNCMIERLGPFHIGVPEPAVCGLRFVILRSIRSDLC